ncbi:hypothetical protein HDU97_007840 [Phlyctochytrium planicorne]|nr:hypothetical protein HDU97_007840 [Phlyctochytrium planicorne]
MRTLSKQTASLSGALRDQGLGSSMEDASSSSLNAKLPRVKIRDFAYPVSDPRHWGEQGISLSKAPTKSSLNLSSSRSQSNQQLDSRHDSSQSGINGEAKAGGNDKAGPRSANTATPMDADSDTTHTNDDDDDDENYIMFTDEVSCYLPRAMALLEQHAKAEEIRLQKKKVLYNFSKVTEWEMDLTSREIVVISYIAGSPIDPEIVQATKKAEQAKSKDSDDKAEKEEGSLDRWGSIEEDDDNLVSLSSTNDTAVACGTESKRDPMSHLPVISLIPEPASFFSQLKEFIDYQPVYGPGWITAIKVRVNDQQGTTKLRMLDIGLVPTSYVGL